MLYNSITMHGEKQHKIPISAQVGPTMH